MARSRIARALVVAGAAVCLAAAAPAAGASTRYTPGAPGVGDPYFPRILSTWVDEHRGGTATTQDFVALSNRISGQDLGEFFQIWLFTPGKPTTW